MSTRPNPVGGVWHILDDTLLPPGAFHGAQWQARSAYSAAPSSANANLRTSAYMGSVTVCRPFPASGSANANTTGWVREPWMRWTFSGHDGDLVTGYGPLYTPPTAGGQLTIETTLLHRGNRSAAYGPSLTTLVSRDPAQRPSASSPAEARWRYAELFMATAGGWGTEWTVRVRVVEMDEGQWFSVDKIVWGDDPSARQGVERPFVQETSPYAPIVGGVIGGFVGLVVVVSVLFCVRRWRRERKERRARREGGVDWEAARGAQNDDIALETLAASQREEQQRRREDDWEGPTSEPAPPPWSAPRDEADGPPPPMPEHGAGGGVGDGEGASGGAAAAGEGGVSAGGGGGGGGSAPVPAPPVPSVPAGNPPPYVG